MCTNCVSVAEAAAAQIAFVCYAVKEPVHRFAAEFGLVDPPDPVGRDVRTAAFLRALDLDSDTILGEDRMRLVAERETGRSRQPLRTASRSRWRFASSALPIGSQSTLTAR